MRFIGLLLRDQKIRCGLILISDPSKARAGRGGNNTPYSAEGAVSIIEMRVGPFGHHIAGFFS